MHCTYSSARNRLLPLKEFVFIMPDLPSPLRGCIESIDRCSAILEAIPVDQYAIITVGKASIGEHVRHCLDHVDCFIAGSAAGYIDYDARQRDPETQGNIESAAQRLAQQRALLESIPPESMDDPVSVQHTCAHGAEPEITSSTIARELAFLSSHTLHHIALVAILAEVQGTAASHELTMAYSTERYRDSLGNAGH